ncbi:hypothetical protein BC828DRAFT_374313 [Blastocladiella britannica]|nr:hypothetical protein BC828DRAFT_374313 [Blastocladiella britannica]
MARRDVITLRENMHNALARLGAANPHHEYPGELRALLRLAEDEHLIYDGVFAEMVRQVTVHMIERGEILAEIRRRYANMFSAIPKVVKNVYAELCSERVTTRRLGAELLRTREAIRTLAERLSAIHRSESLVSAQGSDARTSLLDLMARTDHVDETLGEYHSLYRMQRKRLEQQIRHVDQEKKVWVDAATHLALRIGSEHGLPDVAVLQKYEYGRLRAANHLVSLMASNNRADVARIELRADNWVKEVQLRAHEIDREDIKCLTLLQKTLREIRGLQKLIELDDTADGRAGTATGGGSRGLQPRGRIGSSLTPTAGGAAGRPRSVSLTRANGVSAARPGQLPWDDPTMMPDANSAILAEGGDPSGAMDRARALLLQETRSGAEMLKRWTEATHVVVARYTSDRDEHILDHLNVSQRGLENWIGHATAVLTRTDEMTQRREYQELGSRLALLQEELEGWLERLRAKVSGDDGVASAIISLQNQIEDRTTVFLAARERDRTMPTHERQSLRESLNSWYEQLGIVVAMLVAQQGADEKRLPAAVEAWLSKLTDQLANDIEVRNEENVKLHDSLVRWMVQLLIKSGRQAPDETWDEELSALESDIYDLNHHLQRDAGDLEVLSDDRKDLRQVVRSYSNAWLHTARRLLESEKRSSMHHRKQRHARVPNSQRDRVGDAGDEEGDEDGAGESESVPDDESPVSKALADALGSRELDVLTTQASRSPSRRGSAAPNAVRSSGGGGNLLSPNAGGAASGGSGGSSGQRAVSASRRGSDATMISAALTAANLTSAILNATSAEQAGPRSNGRSLSPTGPQVGGDRRMSTAADAIANAVHTLTKLEDLDSQDNCSDGDSDADSEVMEFDSHYLDKGKDGVGSYPDVSDVSVVPISQQQHKVDAALQGGTAI